MTTARDKINLLLEDAKKKAGKIGTVNEDEFYSGCVHAYEESLAALDAMTVEGEVDKARMDWLEQQCVEVRTPLRYGSRENFHASPEPDDEEPSDLREKIDAAINAPKATATLPQSPEPKPPVSEEEAKASLKFIDQWREELVQMEGFDSREGAVKTIHAALSHFAKKGGA